MNLKRIGLIGGMSFEGSAIYYRKINEAVARALGGLNSADILLASVNFQDIVDMQKAGRWDDAARYLARVAEQLRDGGADCVMICAVTMHLVADTVAQATPLPFIHIVDETARTLRSAGYAKPLLLATRYTMEDGFYQTRMQSHGIEILVPDENDRAVLNGIIFDELSRGNVLDSSRAKLIAFIEKARARGADSVIFGCTEIGMILQVDALPLPGFDSVDIHVDAAVSFALGQRP
ncbi:aspartate racemase [Bordetella genomosp. 10]|uniref:Aspartate racemase n=1 Tax=Bordetella genomosp. 10 TaxID=1416804 RepID=A0A261SMB9_9BORD|nr:aspartate/glutamate racemase family protein [Bordetella genomosp. 10]OZI38092.1 aspartate racemase [Bordetella genomosp. 10]